MERADNQTPDHFGFTNESSLHLVVKSIFLDAAFSAEPIKFLNTSFCDNERRRSDKLLD
jgi:hypothetical protein